LENGNTVINPDTIEIGEADEVDKEVEES